jgi:hypothetical protein
VLQFHLDRLRRKLGESSRAPCYLQSTRSLGVKLVAPRDGGKRGDLCSRSDEPQWTTTASQLVSVSTAKAV